MCRLLARPSLSLVAVVLFMSSAGGQPPAATFTHPDDLAVGPLEAMLQYRVGDTAEAMKARLLFLARDVIAFREFKYDGVAKKYATEPEPHVNWYRSDGGSPIIEVKVGETVWEQKEVLAPTGRTVRQFVLRKGKPPAPRALAFTPVVGTKATRAALLAFQLEVVLFAGLLSG